jgi:hypothetical protein
MGKEHPFFQILTNKMYLEFLQCRSIS